MSKLSNDFNKLTFEQRMEFLKKNRIPESERRIRRPRQGEDRKKDSK